jgi:hypothetical protein
MSAAERLASLPPNARAAALVALDEISRPLDVRDLDVSFARAGIPRSQRRPMMRALLASFEIIALVPRG